MQGRGNLPPSTETGEVCCLPLSECSNDSEAQDDAERQSTSRAVIWYNMYQLMRCPGPPCLRGPYCWINPNGKKRYKLPSLILTETVKYVENDDDNELNDHCQVPGYVRDMIYAEGRQKLDHNRKANTQSPVGMTPFTINNHCPQHPASKLSMPAQSEPLSHTPPNGVQRLSIPGFRAALVREYTD